MKQKYTRRTRTAGLTALFLMVLFISSNPNRASAQNPVTLKISALPYISYAPIFIAEEEGYFAQQGLSMEYVKFEMSGQSMPALARGDLDVSADSIGSSLFSAVSRGLKIKVVADKGHLDDGCCVVAIMVRKELYDSGKLRTISQLEGRKVALSLVPVWGYVYETILSSGGLTLDDVEIVNIPTAARIVALQTGAIDAAGASEPMLSQIESMGIAVKLADYQDFVPNYQYSVIIFGPNLLVKNPDLGRRFMIAYLKGVRQLNRGKTARNLEILQRHTGLEADVLERICFGAFHSNGQVNMDSVREVQEWAFKQKYLDRKVPVDEIVDTSFIEYANRVLGKAE